MYLLTLRENTERPVTVSLGANILVGRNMERLLKETQRILRGEHRKVTHRRYGTVTPLNGSQI